ncbi:MAG TPA: LysR substrate-binding domain-containing protein [Hyphomicrobiaceae bacterium]|jgi:LysR family hydrogen peroxide-inducible transcriptional activator|nr:LysR substrate-binding domain-containing protein [Hyphomicrobiaceae bacterium]
MTSLKQLRYFEAVARFNHFGRAAEHCAVSQPALSMQIQELEKNLGLQLVERRSKGVRLTVEGKEMALRASRILAEVRDLTDFARQRASLLSGALHLGVIPSVAPYVLPPLLPILRDQYPGLDLHIRETQTQALLQQLLDGTLDLLLLALPVNHPEIETIRLFEDRFLLALPRTHRTQGRVRATADLIKGDRLLLLEEGHCLRDQALTFCQLRQVDSINTFGASSLSTIVQMVANGLGLTLLPEISVALETRHADIRVMRFAEPEPSRTLGLAWRSTCSRKRDFVEVGRLITSVARQRPPRKAV